jgi:hypothetical protein
MYNTSNGNACADQKLRQKKKWKLNATNQIHKHQWIEII